MIGLNKLKIGEEGLVTEASKNNRRLKDLGLVKGARVKCVLKSPLGDPSAYDICGAVVAIRKEDASSVKVEVL
ncbi:MAG: ferrous iron transport protein A [Clostridiales bacterium]|nr:ferrous iron transport protein A [Bacillota bacterium]MEE0517176.1 FeoA family protein [Anaerovoracaceae bacterium]PWL95308.1 MAG: ferrous iron transport protein A [Clostridiales bacterium]